MDNKKLNKILVNHKKWLTNGAGAKANFNCADLNGAYFGKVDLTGADLNCANLIDAYFSSAVLKRASLKGANLKTAFLHSANLIGANLKGADLKGAVLREANLNYANLNGANLKESNLIKTNLIGADLRGVNFEKTVFRDSENNEFTTNSIKQFLGLGYNILFYDTHMQIGCKIYKYTKWWAFSNDEITEMDGRKALFFWKKYKLILKNISKNI